MIDLKVLAETAAKRVTSGQVVHAATGKEAADFIKKTFGKYDVTVTAKSSEYTDGTQTITVKTKSVFGEVSFNLYLDVSIGGKRINVSIDWLNAGGLDPSQGAYGSRIDYVQGTGKGDAKRMMKFLDKDLNVIEEYLEELTEFKTWYEGFGSGLQNIITTSWDYGNKG